MSYFDWDTRFEVPDWQIELAKLRKKSIISNSHNNGQLAWKVKFDWDKKIQEYESYYKKGQLREKYILKNNEYEGEKIAFFSNGNLALKCFYKNGKLHGWYKEIYKSGQIKEHFEYWEGGAQPHDPTVRKTYYKNGQLASEENFLDGKYHGITIHYHKNGKKYTEINYLNGKQHGLRIMYFYNGAIHLRHNWKNGKEHGDFELFNGRTRKLKYKIGFKNGKRHGTEIHYEKSGEITTCEWKNGVRDGVAFKYNAQEQPLLKLIYKNGLILEAFNLSDANKKDKNLAEANAFIADFINYQNYKTLKN